MIILTYRGAITMYTSIKKDLLEELVKQHITINFLGKAKLIKELARSKNHEWEAYQWEIDEQIKILDKYKNEAVAGKDTNFLNSVFNVYILLQGAIEKLEKYLELIPKNIPIAKKEITVSLSLFGIFNTSAIIDPKIIEEKVIYINKQIDHLAKTIQEVNEPTLVSKVKNALFQVCHYAPDIFRPS